MSAWEGSAWQEAQERRAKEPQSTAPIPAENSIEAAIKLLSGAGYSVTRKQGQGLIQVVRKRVVSEEPYWRYSVNKYEKRYTPAAGEEIETILLDVNKLKWERHTSSAAASEGQSPGSEAP